MLRRGAADRRGAGADDRGEVRDGGPAPAVLGGVRPDAPAGATVGDFFSKPAAKGGLDFGTIGSSLVLAAVLAALIGHSAWRQRRAAAARPDGRERAVDTNTSVDAAL
ncbi:hypothetical protein NKH77_48990 [Streptomyces sp. M19]